MVHPITTTLNIVVNDTNYKIKYMCNNTEVYSTIGTIIFVNILIAMTFGNFSNAVCLVFNINHIKFFKKNYN